MNTQELKKRMNIMPSGHGHYKVKIIFRGKEYTCITNNMPAIDAFKDEDQGRGHIYSHAQGVSCLWNECKRKNGLN